MGQEVVAKEKVGERVYLEVYVTLFGRRFWGNGCAADETVALSLATQNARQKANSGPPYYTVP